jgi:hypothetical protein
VRYRTGLTFDGEMGDCANKQSDTRGLMEKWENVPMYSLTLGV